MSSNSKTGKHVRISKVIVFCVTPIVPESFMIISSINVLVQLFLMVGGFGGRSYHLCWFLHQWHPCTKSMACPNDKPCRPAIGPSSASAASISCQECSVLTPTYFTTSEIMSNATPTSQSATSCGIENSQGIPVHACLG